MRLRFGRSLLWGAGVVLFPLADFISSDVGFFEVEDDGADAGGDFHFDGADSFVEPVGLFAEEVAGGVGGVPADFVGVEVAGEDVDGVFGFDFAAAADFAFGVEGEFFEFCGEVPFGADFRFSF